jgi:hypothetical protein
MSRIEVDRIWPTLNAIAAERAPGPPGGPAVGLVTRRRGALRREETAAPTNRWLTPRIAPYFLVVRAGKP